MTSLDTNVLVAFGSINVQTTQLVSVTLERLAAQGSLCICGAVFTELLGSPTRNGRDLRSLFATLRILIDWRMEEADWEAAGIAYQGYVNRRKASGGGFPRRIVTDFLIGAHAAVRGYSLLTLDKRLYSAAFPQLRIETF
jgi:predicted nucleic acid-binding protein